jgi:hypothetical protein
MAQRDKCAKEIKLISLIQHLAPESNACLKAQGEKQVRE